MNVSLLGATVSRRQILDQIAAGCEWPVDIVDALYQAARDNTALDALTMRRIKGLTDLLPPSWLPRLTREFVASNIPRAPEPEQWQAERRDALDALLGTWASGKAVTDEESTPVWPFRAKKDKEIRRARLADVFELYRGEETLLRERCLALPGFDQIAVQNILFYARGFEATSWFELCKEWGRFDGDVVHWGTSASWLSNKLKRQKPEDFDRWSHIENGALGGYRNPPFPGFNILEKAHDLADSGNKKGGLFPDRRLEEFEFASQCLEVVPDHVEYVHPKTWLYEGKWETAGSSSIGRVELEVKDAKPQHFKARKNLVRDVVSFIAMWLLMLAWAVRMSWTIVKAELGKLRIAVASDIVTYWWISWLMWHVNSAYKKWPYATIEENYLEQTNRQINTWEKLPRRWHIPEDAAEFDHQPDNDETKIINRRLVSIGSHNMPETQRQEWSPYLEKVSSLNDEAYLVTRIPVSDPDAHTGHGERTRVGDNFEYKEKVNGGVQSGGRETSPQGNGWMTVQMERATQIMRALGLRELDQILVRGDDADGESERYVFCLLFHLILKACGLRTADGKFGILWAETEFLRIFYTVEGLHGYPARAAPGASQSKPWSNTPITAEAVMRALYDNTTILRRRGYSEEALDRWWSVLRAGWSERRGTDPDWLSIPTGLGGLGVEPMKAMSKVKKAWKAPKAERLTVLDQSDWRRELVAEEFSDWALDPTEVAELSQQRARDKIMADDVPNVRGTVFEDTGPPEDTTVRLISLAMPGTTLNELFRVYALCRAQTPTDLREGLLPNLQPGAEYGMYHRLLPLLRQLGELARIRKELKIMSWLRMNDIGAWGAIVALEDRGLSRTEAIAWLTGDMSSPVSRSLHPMLAADVSRLAIFCIQSVVQYRFMRPGNLTWFHNRAFQILEEACVSSPAVRVVYTW